MPSVVYRLDRPSNDAPSKAFANGIDGVVHFRGVERLYLVLSLSLDRRHDELFHRA